MTATRTIAKNTFALSLGEISSKSISFVFNIFLARLLGASLYGEYNLINAFIGIFSFLPDLGTNLIVIRNIARHPASHARLVGQAVIINTVLSALTFFLIASLFGPYSHGKAPLAAAVLAAATLVLTAIRTTAVLQFDAHEHMGWSAVFNVINNLTSTSGAVIGFGIYRTLTGLFAGVFMGTLLSLLFAWLSVARRYPLPTLSFNRSKLLALFSAGLPMGLAAFSAQIYSRVDILIIGRLLQASVLGWYSAASVLVIAGSQLVTVPLMSAIFPTLSKIYGQKIYFKKMVYRILVAITVITAVPVVLTQIIASPLVQILYGQGFSSTAGYLKILIFTIPPATISAFWYKLLIIANRQKTYFKISLVGAVLSLLFNLLLIPALGAVGAAYAAIVSQLVLLTIYTMAAYRFVL